VSHFGPQTSRKYQPIDAFTISMTINRIMADVRSKAGHLTSIAGSFKAVRGRRQPRREDHSPLCTSHLQKRMQVRATGNFFAIRGQMGHAPIHSMVPRQHQETDQLGIAVKRNADHGAPPAAGHTNRPISSNPAGMLMIGEPPSFDS
jgi:hypothetical protein